MNGLIIPKNQDLIPENIFKPGGVNTILSVIKKEVQNHKPDVETAKGRKEIASLSYKVARSKTFLDNMGKELKSKYKALIDPIDSERKKCRDELDLLKNQIRKPLDDWEAEQERIKQEKQLINDWEQAIKEDELFNREREIRRKEEEVKRIEDERIEKERIEKEKAEEEKKRKEREMQIQKETEKRLKLESEEELKKIREEAERKEREQKEAAEKAKIEYEKALEEERLRAEKEKQALIDKQLREDEERRLIEVKKAADERKRQLDVEHRKTVNNAILTSLKEFCSEEVSKEIIKAILNNKIPYVSIKY